MATDEKARKVVFNYTGGAVTMTRGLADELFGVTWRIQQAQPANKTVSVKSHQRVRVIGQPAKTVGAYNYTFKAFPTMDAEAAMGGQACIAKLDDGSQWTIRVSGPMSTFCEWFQGGLLKRGVNILSQRGTIYGPFNAVAITNP
jgi:hypothetical protein